jgi:hypothetical protein
MTDITYFNHPFVEGSTIMLVNDVEMEKAVSKTSLSSNNMYGAPEKKPTLNQYTNSNIAAAQFGDIDSLIATNAASVWIARNASSLWYMPYKDIKPLIEKVDKVFA